MNEWFGVEVGLRQGCVMLTWLYKVHMDGVVREESARASERGV